MVTLSEKVIIILITCISAVAISCLIYYFIGENKINVSDLSTTTTTTTTTTPTTVTNTTTAVAATATLTTATTGPTNGGGTVDSGNSKLGFVTNFVY